MELFQEYRGKARQRLKNADHLITNTYPLVRDNKLLLAAAENLCDSLNFSVLSVISYGQLRKAIPRFDERKESSIKFFAREIVPLYKKGPAKTSGGKKPSLSSKGKKEILAQPKKSGADVFDKKYIKLITDLNELITLHRESAVEFSRKDKFVIASGTYKMIELSHGQLKDSLEMARRFIEAMEIIVSNDEPLPRRRI